MEITMRLDTITPDILRRKWQVPDPAVVADYWAYTSVTNPWGPTLPRRFIHGVLPQGELPVWVDSEEGWLWANPPLDEWHWSTPAQTYAHARAAIPGWLQAAGTNAGDRLLLRHQITREQAGELLDQFMPPVEDYPIPGELAAILRAGGWAPRDLAGLWWRVERLADARLLASHLPAWWAHAGWPLRTTSFSGAKAAGITPWPAHRLGLLQQANVRPDVFREAICAGMDDLDAIAALEAPHIPDDAARIYYQRTPGVRWADVDIDVTTARRRVDEYPRHWITPPTVDTTPVTPVHVSSVWDGAGENVVVWSDGRLDNADVNSPDSVPAGEPMRTWHRQYNAFAATQDLLDLIVRAGNRAALGPHAWGPWQHATGVDVDTTVTRSHSRVIGVDTTAERIVTVSRYTVHCVDGIDRSVWHTAEEIVIADPVWSERRNPGRRVIDTTEDAAATTLAGIDDDLPVVATVAEIAGRAGVTRNALAQALSRGRRATGAPSALHWTGRTGWYDPRRVLAWLADRPGRGRVTGIDPADR